MKFSFAKNICGETQKLQQNTERRNIASKEQMASLTSTDPPGDSHDHPCVWTCPLTTAEVSKVSTNNKGGVENELACCVGSCQICLRVPPLNKIWKCLLYKVDFFP